MELKVVCNCGQKYKFDVEPVHGRMPFPVNCPACAADGTQLANARLAQMPTSVDTAPAPAPIPVAALIAPAPVPAMAAPAPMPVGAMSAPSPSAAHSGLRLNRAEPPPPPVAPPISAPVVGAPAPRAAALPKYMQTNPATQNNNFLLGIVGALLGAVVAVGLMVAFTMFTGMKFPLLGTVEGAIIGFGARLLYRGTSSTLGAMSAAVAFVTIIATFLLMFNIISILMSGVISLLVGVSIAFKVAS
jgi:hypothetical protein